MLKKLTSKLIGTRDSSGNILIMAVMVVVLMSTFGSVMLVRMIIDSDASAKQVNSTKAFYIADAGIQRGRKYLTTNTSNNTYGPTSFLGGTLTVSVIQGSEYIDGPNSSVNVYKITSTATVGNATRSIVELRKRGNPNNKSFLAWREDLSDQY